LFAWAFQFLKEELAGLEFILSHAEGLQSFCEEQKACPNERIHSFGRGFTLQSLMRHQTLMKKFSSFIGLQTENNNRIQVFKLLFKSTVFMGFS